MGSIPSATGFPELPHPVARGATAGVRRQRFTRTSITTAAVDPRAVRRRWLRAGPAVPPVVVADLNKRPVATLWICLPAPTGNSRRAVSNLLTVVALALEDGPTRSRKVDGVKSYQNFILDDYVSPKLVGGPRALMQDPQYRELVRRLREVDFFTASAWSFVWRSVAFAIAYFGAYGYLLTGPGVLGQVIACCIIGFAHVQGNFVAHDAGHGAVTKNQVVVGAIGQFFDTLLGGYSFAYFRRSHDLHHYHCNEVDVDPNTMELLFSMNERALHHTSAVTRATTSVQHILIPLLYPFWPLLLRGVGLAYIVRNWPRTWIDAVFMLGHIALWFVLPVHYLGWGGAMIAYFGMTAVAGIYIGLIIPINHLGMPTLDTSAAGSSSFIVQQVTTSRNLTSSPVRDFLFIGQNSQIEHHLFPWAPTFNLGRGRKIVREYCRELGIRYHECTYPRALWEIHHHLAEMARHARSKDQELQHELLRRAS
jgi:fatty acid desaturase